jgi:hypothetical protein
MRSTLSLSLSLILHTLAAEFVTTHELAVKRKSMLRCFVVICMVRTGIDVIV